jgi:polyhydroxyalkanoate synthesis regulator phasin
MDKRQALRQNIDGRIADYIDEVDRVQTLELNSANTQRRKNVESLRAEIDRMREEVRKLTIKVEMTPEMDDKYAITKAKLIQLMKDMGYYD